MATGTVIAFEDVFHLLDVSSNNGGSEGSGASCDPGSIQIGSRMQRCDSQGGSLSIRKTKCEIGFADQRNAYVRSTLFQPLRPLAAVS